MKLYKIFAVAMIIGILSTILIGCGTPHDVKKEAKKTLAAYKQPFIDRIEETYGSDAKLKNIKCSTITRIGSPVPSVSYDISTKLTGTIVKDWKRYRAYYYYSDNIIVDSVHSEDIINTIVDSLPLNPDDRLGVKVSNQFHEYPMFPPEVTTFDEALNAETMNGHIDISVITSEDLSSYKDFDFGTIETLDKIINNPLSCEIRVISLKDNSMLSSLEGKVRELHFSYENSHPKVYGRWGYVDSFEYFHIRNTLDLFLKRDRDGKPYLKCVYNE